MQNEQSVRLISKSAGKKLGLVQEIFQGLSHV